MGRRWVNELTPALQRQPPRGFSLPEVLVAFLGLLLLIQAGWSVLSTFRKAAERAQETTEGLETVRTVGWILREELEGGNPGVDWLRGGGDSVALRAFRGLALVRDRKESGEVVVCFSGIRYPNPEKDSLLVLGDDGVWRALGLLRRVGGEVGCWDGTRGREETWEVEGREGPSTWHLARVFERGSYHFSDGAFRYRAGGAGRQPLTLPNVQEGGFSPVGAGLGETGWWLRLVSGSDGVGTVWRGSLP